MTAKRFIITDNLPKGTHSNIWDKQKQHNQGIGDELWLGEVVAMLNEGVILAEENGQLKTQLQNTSDQRDEFHRGARENANRVGKLKKENEQLKKELHLMHMRTMFSTVQSFKGDVSKRYKYSKETDTVYDTANHYGQYDKVLDKAEIVMLLNEYETVLNELKGDLE